MSAGNGRGPGRRWRLLLAIVALAAVILSLNVLSALLIELFEMELTPGNEPVVHRAILLSVIAYALFIAIPFVPAIEIGIALLILGGSGFAVLVYMGTVLGLFLSFLIGDLVPRPWLKSAFEGLHLTRAGRLIGELEPLEAQQRIEVLVSRAPSRIVPFLLRHRYVALAVALNVPGNALVGGGGGISMMAGLSKLYSRPGFLLTLVLAVMPVPLAVLLLG